jgi:hypothetical protein
MDAAYQGRALRCARRVDTLPLKHAATSATVAEAHTTSCRLCLMLCCLLLWCLLLLLLLLLLQGLD